MRFMPSLHQCGGLLKTGQICNSALTYDILMSGVKHVLCAQCITKRVEDWELVAYELRATENRLTALRHAAAEEEH